MDQKPANALTRFGAAILDAMLCFLLLTVVSSFVSAPIIGNLEGYKTNYEIYETKLVSSGLFVKEENALNVVIADFSMEKVDEYDRKLIEFYQAYPSEEENKVESYVESKKKATDVFTYHEEDASFEVTGSEAAVSSFYQQAYSDALVYFRTADSEYGAAYSKVYLYTQVNRYVSISVGLLIVYLLFPMVFKNGETLGKKLFSLRLAKADHPEARASRVQILVRFAVIAFIEVGLSLFFWWIPLILSLCLMLFTKNKSALHDLIAKTTVMEKVKDLPTYRDKRTVVLEESDVSVVPETETQEKTAETDENETERSDEEPSEK